MDCGVSMSLLVIAFLLAIPISVVILISLLIREIRQPVHSWRGWLTEIGMGTALASGLILCTFLIKTSVSHDSSLHAGSERISNLVLWGHWGMWTAAVAFLIGAVAKSWARIATMSFSALFASIWILAYSMF
jgi:hypothetical protein